MHNVVSRVFAVVLLAVASLLVVPTGTASAASFVCGTQSGGSTRARAAITDVRVGRHVGYDRFVVQFSGTRMPHWTIVPKSSSTFYLDPSNRRVTLLGRAGLKVVLFPASGIGTYHGPRDFRTGFRRLLEARQIGDFEAVTTWGLGLSKASCKRVLVLSAPVRLVIDVPNS